MRRQKVAKKLAGRIFDIDMPAKMVRRANTGKL